MKVSRDQVAENRRRILDAAARLFRERGFEGVTVAEIMRDAGLTHGAFYGHFASKDDLVAAAFAHVLAAQAAATQQGTTIADYAGGYLSGAHLAQPGAGCLFAALGTEAARSSPEVRQTMTEAIRRRLDTLARTAPGETDVERHRAAIVGWSAMVGALILARISDDPGLSENILAETRAALGA